VFVGAAGVTGYGVPYANEALENDLCVPEAAFGEISHCFVGSGFAQFFFWYVNGLGLAAGGQEKYSAEREKELFHIYYLRALEVTGG
jgi:hypothetical protein